MKLARPNRPITENTLVPIGLAVAVIGGGAIWFTSLYAKTNVLTENDVTRKESIQEIQRDVGQIKLDVMEIKTILREKQNGSR